MLSWKINLVFCVFIWELPTSCFPLRASATNANVLRNRSSYVRCASTLNMVDSTDNEVPCYKENYKIVWSDGSSQDISSLEAELYSFLKRNIMPFDIPNAESFGFPKDEDDGRLPDGLSNGIIGPTIALSIDSKINYPWTDSIPKEIFVEYVTPYANANEARSNWRPYFHEKIASIVQPFLENQISTREDVIHALNEHVWTIFSKDEANPIFFKAGQTPLIYDPMSILAFGYASCTGLSIFLVDILRTAGIPARLAGTNAWNGNRENGNHSWIEFFGSDNEWHIMEARPASGGGGERKLTDPCQWWFCNSDKVQGTSFYAARYDRCAADSVPFPLAWDSENLGVVGEDRTEFMRALCSNC